MKLLPQSNPARRIIRSGVIVVLLLAVLYGGFRWWDHRRQQWIEEFVRTTSIDDNPWGIERGMFESDVGSLPGFNHYYDDVTSWGLLVVYDVEYQDVRWNVEVHYEGTDPGWWSREAGKMEVRLSNDRNPTWLEWLLRPTCPFNG